MGLDPPCCRHRMWGIKKILQNGWAPGNVIDTKWQGSCSSQTPRYRHPFCRGQNVHDPMVAPRIKEPFCRPPPLQNPSAKAHLSFSQAPHFVERYHFVGINRSSSYSVSTSYMTPNRALNKHFSSENTFPCGWCTPCQAKHSAHKCASQWETSCPSSFCWLGLGKRVWPECFYKMKRHSCNSINVSLYRRLSLQNGSCISHGILTKWQGLHDLHVHFWAKIHSLQND